MKKRLIMKKSKLVDLGGGGSLQFYGGQYYDTNLARLLDDSDYTYETNDVSELQDEEIESLYLENEIEDFENNPLMEETENG